LTPAQAEEYLALMQANFDAYDLIDALPDEIPAVHYPRAAGYRPDGDENPLNAWYYKTEVQVQRPASWPAAPWRSRTTSRWLAYR
jgi:amidase